jgi:type I restriction-modification system DNA methylase subunit
MSLLEEAWKNVKIESTMVYKEWSKYLSIVYGSEVQNEQLFLRHTYLATLAKMMVFSFYQENTIPTSHDIISRILKGDVFREWSIENFLIEDFFSWIVRSNAFKYGTKVALRILDGLEMYDLTKLNEDVLKELYQQLVDPSERRYLGEFYTPDWLAEMMVREVVKDVRLRVLDPACGSGTFLASAIRH